MVTTPTKAGNVSKHGIKMKGAVAVQRQILELIFILYKTKNPFDPYYQFKTVQQSEVDVPLQSTLCCFQLKLKNIIPIFAFYHKILVFPSKGKDTPHTKT